MKLLSRNKPKPTALPIAAPDSLQEETPLNGSPADDLVGLEKLAEWKQNLKRLEADYKRGQTALVAARRLVAGTDPLPQPDLTWHVRRELLVAEGDTEAIAKFDAEHAGDLANEVAARQHALQAKTEAEAKVRALTEYLNDIAKQMAALADGDLYRREAKRLFQPSARRTVAAAKVFAKAHREMVAMERALTRACRMHQRYVDGTRIEEYPLELIERKEPNEWLSQFIEGTEYEDLLDLNRDYLRPDEATYDLVLEKLAAAGIDASWPHVYHPHVDRDTISIYAPDPNPPKKSLEAWSLVLPADRDTPTATY